MVEHHTNYGDGDDWTVRDVVSVSRECACACARARACVVCVCVYVDGAPDMRSNFTSRTTKDVIH